MTEEVKGRFWRGPIVSERHAVSIASTTGWIFGLLGALMLLAVFTSPDSSGSGRGGGVVAAVLFVAPGAFLASRKARTPAAILLVICGLAAATATATALAGAGGAGVRIALAGVALFQLALSWMSWRAFKAASALRAFRRQPSTSAIAETFE